MLCFCTVALQGPSRFNIAFIFLYKKMFRSLAVVKEMFNFNVFLINGQICSVQCFIFSFLYVY